MGSKPLHTKLREKRNRPPEGEPFVWFTREMSESDALRTAPARTIHFVLRLMVEHMDHAGKENGRLICTWDQCVAWGIPRKHVKAAQADAIRRGLVYQTEKGTASKGAGRRPSKFGLGWLPAHDGAPAANLWKRYRSALNPREDLKSSSAGGT